MVSVEAVSLDVSQKLRNAFAHLKLADPLIASLGSEWVSDGKWPVLDDQTHPPRAKAPFSQAKP